METIRCTYCGRRGDGPLLEVDLRGVRYDYCDATCATAHRMAVELTAVLCPDCDADAMGDTGCCGEHPLVEQVAAVLRGQRPPVGPQRLFPCLPGPGPDDVVRELRTLHGLVRDPGQAA